MHISNRTTKTKPNQTKKKIFVLQKKNEIKYDSILLCSFDSLFYSQNTYHIFVLAYHHMTPVNKQKTILSLSLSLSISVHVRSVELQKANLQENNAQTVPVPGAGGVGGAQQSTSPSGNTLTTAASNNPLASAIPLAQLLTKPGALNALSSLSALGGLTDLLGGLVNMGAGVGAAGTAVAAGGSGGGGSGASIQTTGVHRQSNKTFAPRMRSPNGNSSDSRKSDRNKFNPY